MNEGIHTNTQKDGRKLQEQEHTNDLTAATAFPYSNLHYLFHVGSHPPYRKAKPFNQVLPNGDSHPLATWPTEHILLPPTHTATQIVCPATNPFETARSVVARDWEFDVGRCDEGKGCGLATRAPVTRWRRMGRTASTWMMILRWWSGVSARRPMPQWQPAASSSFMFPLSTSHRFIFTPESCVGYPLYFTPPSGSFLVPSGLGSLRFLLGSVWLHPFGSLWFPLVPYCPCFPRQLCLYLGILPSL